LSNADIFVLNSYYEGMPSILVEAASTDIAIISTNCKHGPSELLNGVDHCRLIEVNNENQLIDAINHFSRIRKTKRKKIEHLQEFNIEESMSKYLKLLRELIT
jgi:Glycosyltransferase